MHGGGVSSGHQREIAVRQRIVDAKPGSDRIAFMAMVLEHLCILKIVGELEHYPSAFLALLPWHLRQKLLCSLPLADICQLERNPLITHGVTMNAIWDTLCTRFLGFFSPQDSPGGAYLVRFEQLPHPKDIIMAMIAKLILISVTGIMATCYALRLCSPEFTALAQGQKAGIQNFSDKWGIIRTLIFCSHFSTISSSLNTESFVHIKLFPNVASLQPRRHSAHFALPVPSTTIEMIKTFMSVCNAVPKVLRFRKYDSIETFKLKSPESRLVLQSFLSGIEDFSIDRSLAQLVPFSIPSLLQVFQAITSPSTASLHSLRIKGVPFFLKERIQDITTYFAPVRDSVPLDDFVNYVTEQHCDSSSVYRNLKKIEILNCPPEDKEVVTMRRDEPICLLSGAIPSLIAMVIGQTQLEELNVDHLYDLCEGGVSYVGFEEFYFSLQFFITSSCFQSLRLANCHIPVNIAQQLVNIFAHHPTTHPTTLDISECYFDEASTFVCESVSSEYSSQLDTSCRWNSGHLKTLAVPIQNCGMSSKAIILPNTQLKCLQVSVWNDDIHLSDVIKYVKDVKQQPRELDIHIILFYSPSHDDLDVIDKILAFPHLTKIRIEYFGCEPTSTLHYIASGLRGHSTGMLHTLSLNVTAKTLASSYLQVYEAIFSLPQLTSFSLELTFGALNRQYHVLIDAWKLKSEGRKLLNLTGLELDENLVNDFVSVARQVAVNVYAFDRFY